MYNTLFFDSVLGQLDAGNFNGGLHFLAGALLPESSSSSAKPVLRDHLLHRVLLEDPYTARAFGKPRGYAGDAVLIDMIYDQQPPEETSPRGRDIFAVTTSFSVARAVRERRVFAAEMLEREWHAGKRICALACGHLREADGLVGHDLSNITAVDQDDLSLERVRNLHQGRIKLEAANVLQFLRRAARLGERFDHIYTLGLTDYFDDRAMRLLHALMVKCLNPGGTILVANFIRGHIASGWMDAVMDWHLIYRSETELRRFAQESGMQSRTWLDSTGSIAWCEMTAAG